MNPSYLPILRKDLRGRSFTDEEIDFAMRAYDGNGKAFSEVREEIVDCCWEARRQLAGTKPKPVIAAAPKPEPNGVKARAQVQRGGRNGQADSAWLCLLRAALTLTPPFTKSQLAVAAYKAYPTVFRLEGYPYPDSNKAWSYFYGRHGLIANKMVDRVARGKFTVTAMGRRLVATANGSPAE